MNFEQTMHYGESQYRDVINALAEQGLAVAFTQTGGMNAALEAVLDGGAYLLITDAEESLAWERSGHVGWAVGLYPNAEELETQLASLASEDGDVETLLRPVKGVLQLGRQGAG